MNIRNQLLYGNVFQWNIGVECPHIEDIEHIRKILLRDDVCVFNFSPQSDYAIMINQLAKSLNLNTPFISSSNLKHHSKNFNGNVNFLGSKDLTSNHIVFDQNTDQGLHVDGTFEDIGAVGTTILCCIEPAAFGGESTFFHATKAFQYFYQHHPEMAEKFLNKEALLRFNYGHEDRGREIKIGPAFAYKGNQLLTRFTVDRSADWEYGFKHVDGLREAFTEFQNFYALNSPFVKVFKLNKYQGVIFSNSLVSHGRLSFSNSPSQRRVYCRGLFKEQIND